MDEKYTKIMEMLLVQTALYSQVLIASIIVECSWDRWCHDRNMFAQFRVINANVNKALYSSVTTPADLCIRRIKFCQSGKPMNISVLTSFNQSFCRRLYTVETGAVEFIFSLGNVKLVRWKGHLFHSSFCSCTWSYLVSPTWDWLGSSWMETSNNILSWLKIRTEDSLDLYL